MLLKKYYWLEAANIEDDIKKDIITDLLYLDLLKIIIRNPDFRNIIYNIGDYLKEKRTRENINNYVNITTPSNFYWQNKQLRNIINKVNKNEFHYLIVAINQIKKRFKES